MKIADDKLSVGDVDRFFKGAYFKPTELIKFSIIGNALVRYEFLELLVRISSAKYKDLSFSEGFTKLLFDAESHRILGGGIVGTHAGDMIGEVALAIEMGADEVDIGKTIHPHPTLGESIGLAAEVAHGSCTDLPPARR